MTLIKHTNNFFTIHTSKTSDCCFVEGLYIKCKQFDLEEWQVEEALDTMYYNNHNAVHYDDTKTLKFSYKLGGI